jgi:hypothetical protein
MDYRDQAINFVEHCALVASGSPQTYDGVSIQYALRLVAEAFWPDLLEDAKLTYDGEADEIKVETPNALYSIAIRAVER